LGSLKKQISNAIIELERLFDKRLYENNLPIENFNHIKTQIEHQISNVIESEVRKFTETHYKFKKIDEFRWSREIKKLMKNAMKASRAGNYNKAIDIYSRVIELDEKCIDAYLDRGINFKKSDQKGYAENDFNKVIELCQEKISTKKSNSEVLFNIGCAFGYKGNYKRMKENFNASLKIDTRFNDKINFELEKYYIKHFNEATQYLDNGKYKKAIEMFNISIELLPKRYEAYLNLAVTYLQTDNDSMAIKTYNRALKEMPDNLRFAYNLGLTHYNNGNYKQAIEAFNLVVEKSEASSKLYFESLFNMANAYAMMKQEDKALEIYEQALKNDPENTMILFNMGRMLLIQESYEKAIEVLEKVLAKNPDDYDANFAIGTAYLQINNELIDIFNKKVDNMSESETKERREEMDVNFKKALPHFEKAVEMKPDNSSAWQQLGTVYVRLGETKKGEEAFAKSDELRAQGK